MNKYITKDGISVLISFNTETEEVSAVDYLRTHIDWVYQIPEDGVLQTENGEKTVKKGDIVIKFYPCREYPITQAIVIRNTEWKNNIKNERLYNESLRKEFALKENESDAVSACSDCEANG